MRLQKTIIVQGKKPKQTAYITMTASDCLVVRSSALIESVFPSEAARGAHQLSSSTGGCLPVCTAEAEGSASTRTALICGTRHWAGVHTPLYAMTQGTAAAP